ncbi:MAG: competence/damage-inducible protein A [Candidatus Rifleibacteriota bacterium]
MNTPIIAEILSVGTEILLGEIVDTNASWIAARLNERGIQIFRKQTVGDNLSRLCNALELALNRADIVIVTGGLGPTDDDMTREAICSVFNEKPAVDSALLENLQQMFKKRNRPMPEANNKQAWLIESAEGLDNPFGTACGWAVKKNGKLLFALPGPPSEMKKMWADQVEPRLPDTGQCFYHTTVHTCSIGESHLAELIADYTVLKSPGIGTYARANGVDVRVGAVAATEEEAKQIVMPAAAEIERRLHEFVYGRDGETLVSAIMKMLNLRNEKFSCMESLTGGAIAAEVTACPGISSCFAGSITAYSAEAKIAFGICPETIEQYGVVSQQVAEEMAKCVKKMFKTSWGIATTGVAGPDGHDGKQPGTAWVAVAGPEKLEAMLVDWPGDRAMIINRVRRSALQMLWSALRRLK